MLSEIKTVIKIAFEQCVISLECFYKTEQKWSKCLCLLTLSLSAKTWTLTRFPSGCSSGARVVFLYMILFKLSYLAKHRRDWEENSLCFVRDKCLEWAGRGKAFPETYLHRGKEIAKWPLKRFWMMLPEINSAYQIWTLASRNQNFPGAVWILL